MSTPLYKAMRTKGTSLYAFPSAAQDMSKTALNFSKFLLLHIPMQEVLTGYTAAGADPCQLVLNFDRETYSYADSYYPFYTTDPNSPPTKLSDQLVESLRNYVANYDAEVRASLQTQTTDFYNVNEIQTPSEAIFWKWCHKLNILDVEPATHAVDWDKTLPDFDNPNADTVTHSDYFRRYLWKEREVVEYTISGITNTTPAEIIVEDNVKLRAGDRITITGTTESVYNNTVFEVIEVSITGGVSTIQVYNPGASGTSTGGVLSLSYQRLVNYIGEIDAQGRVETSRRNYLDATADIPSHAGRTPTVLFSTVDTQNYYPGLELPILPSQIQPEILGAENLTSPIRTNPGNYPGLHYGQFDTTDKTYLCSTGDRVRLKGDYYGVLLTNNVGTEADDYFEKLSDFDASEIDGISLDFDHDHYLKMNLPGRQVSNFNEFDSLSVDGITPPEDFLYNAILWFYEIDDGKGRISNNLYGITFLNNPEDDDGDEDGLADDHYITPYNKRVSNGTQDGLAYIHNINLSMEVDTDMLPMTYDASAVYNMFGFDLYNNVMTNLARLNDQFMTIITQYLSMNQQLNDVRSLVYSQTDLDRIKSRMTNMEELLKLYSKMQLVDSPTAKIEVDYTGVYPTVAVNVEGQEYSNALSLTSLELVDYSVANTGASYPVPVPDTGRMLVMVTNNDINGVYQPLALLLDKDLAYLQPLDVIVKANQAAYTNTFDLRIMFDDGAGPTETTVVEGITLPVDLNTYDPLVYNRVNYIKSDVVQNVEAVLPSGITSHMTTMLYLDSWGVFNPGEYIYVDNFVLMTSTGAAIIDRSGLYRVMSSERYATAIYVEIDLDSNILNDDSTSAYYNPEGDTLLCPPTVRLYRGIKYSILRTSDDSSSSVTDRYLIQRSFL